MDYYLTAQSRYLEQIWLIISEILSPEGNFAEIAISKLTVLDMS